MEQKEQKYKTSVIQNVVIFALGIEKRFGLTWRSIRLSWFLDGKFAWQKQLWKARNSMELSKSDLVKWKKKIESFHIDISFIRFEPIVNKEGRSN